MSLGKYIISKLPFFILNIVAFLFCAIIMKLSQTSIEIIIIILKYFDDLTFKDIAEILEMPENTVKTNLYKGLSILRNDMKKEII